jgi:hypothetical protein
MDKSSVTGSAIISFVWTSVNAHNIILIRQTGYITFLKFKRQYSNKSVPY